MAKRDALEVAVDRASHKRSTDDAVNLAIHEERERCAEIALQIGRDLGESAVGAQIASVIRSNY